MNSIPKTVSSLRIIDNPDMEALRQMARYEEKTTQHGSASYVTKVRNRSAKNTYIVANGISIGVRQREVPFADALSKAQEVQEYLKERKLIRLDKKMGESAGWSYHCRLYITAEYARIPFMWDNTLFDIEDKNAEPDFVSIFVPEWPERLIFLDPLAGVTYILGTDYFGECKKAFLRMAMFKAKQNGGLGLHAGSKVIRIEKDNEIQNVGFIMFGLSGTGKTTLTIHDHGLSGNEGVIIKQDDVVLMDGHGRCYGTENGFFIKTEGLDETQRVLYKAASSDNASFENVKVNENGTLDFADSELTSNGRGVVLRRDVDMTDDTIDLDCADRVIFITRRNDVVPVVAKLTPAQAAMFFMLGESIETSAGDPTKAGQAKREVGTNPFIVGSEAEEGNRFLEILQNNPQMECFLLNTGSIGMKDGSHGEKVTIPATTEIMKSIAKSTITWEHDEDWGYEVPVHVPGVDIEKYDPRKYYGDDEYRKLTDKLKAERKQWLAQFPGLDAQIISALEA